MRTRYLYLYSGAIGEALLGVHIARTLAANVPGAVVSLVSPRPNPFVEQLADVLPFIEYRAIDKRTLGGWLSLLGLIGTRWHTAVLEPVTIKPPVWWEIILWCTRVMPGGKEVRYQMCGQERALPRYATPLTYDCQAISYFDTPAMLLPLWGVQNTERPAPALPPREEGNAEPYILFHFFAGNYKRSIPLEHARAILTAARESYPTYRFVLTCMDSEAERARAMGEGFANLEIKAGKGTDEVLDLLVNADLIVGTASGILLAAAHYPVPIVALSCLSDPCWLPTFNPLVSIVAARSECRCTGNKATDDCSVATPEGDVFRCLYFITTEEVLASMQAKLPPPTHL